MEKNKFASKVHLKISSTEPEHEESEQHKCFQNQKMTRAGQLKGKKRE